MRRIADSLSRLSALRMPVAAPPAGARLRPFDGFGANPGALTAKCFVPAALPARAALVVVLHGCTQTAEGYDAGSGWSALAERHGFALLYPEQSRSNNPSGCFNWFGAADIGRGGGEAMSIQQMIDSAIERFDLDPRRVFVTGLSAGGAMALAMLAAYPELFAGGAVIAGLAYGVAHSVPEALDRMRGQGLPDTAGLDARVRDASDFTGPWPTLSVWQGTADRTVDPANAEAILRQWRGVHGLPETPLHREVAGGITRRAWRDETGREAIEAWTIDGMGHGTPIASGPGGVGTPGPYMLDVGLSSTQHIAAHWGLAPPLSLTVRSPNAAPPPPRGAARRVAPSPAGPAGGTDVGRVIENALRAAGLLRCLAASWRA